MITLVYSFAKRKKVWVSYPQQLVPIPPKDKVKNPCGLKAFLQFCCLAPLCVWSGVEDNTPRWKAGRQKFFVRTPCTETSSQKQSYATITNFTPTMLLPNRTWKKACRQLPVLKILRLYKSCWLIAIMALNTSNEYRFDKARFCW